MATESKQSRLESEAIPHREGLLIRNDYQEGDHEYSEAHPDAMATGDPLGKGTGVPLGVAPRPGSVDSKAISYSNMNTIDGGGQYDVEGRDSVGKSGRVQLMAMNLYNKENYYDTDSVDTTENRNRGQYFVE